MRVEIVLPQWTMGMSTGTVAKWAIRIGDKIKEGDVIADVETDKATNELVATQAGVLTEIVVEEGTTVEVGTVLAYMTV